MKKILFTCFCIAGVVLALMAASPVLYVGTHVGNGVGLTNVAGSPAAFLSDLSGAPATNLWWASAGNGITITTNGPRTLLTFVTDLTGSGNIILSTNSGAVNILGTNTVLVAGANVTITTNITAGQNAFTIASTGGGGGGDVTQAGQNNFTGSNSLSGFTMFLGPVQVSNNTPAVVISQSNTFQIDTPGLKKAVQVDTNGNVYFAGAVTVTGGTGTTTNNNLVVQGWLEVDGLQTNKATNYGVALVLTNSSNGGSWKSPTNAPASGQVVQATGTSGDTKWATPAGGGDVTQAGQNNFTGYNTFQGPTWFSNVVYVGGTSTNTINTDISSALFDSVHNYEYAWWNCSSLGNPNVFGDFYSSQGGHSVATGDATHPNSDDYVTQSNGQTNGIQGSKGFTSARDLKFMSHVAFVQTNAVRYFIGLSTHSFDTMPASDNPSGAYACWRYSDGVGNTLHCVTKDTFTQTDTDSLVVATTGGTFHKYGIFITGAGTVANFYLDGKFITNITTHLPAGSSPLTITVCGQNTSTGTKDVQIAKSIVQQTDP